MFIFIFFISFKTYTLATETDFIYVDKISRKYVVLANLPSSKISRQPLNKTLISHFTGYFKSFHLLEPDIGEKK
jgi:hypothetical protein